MNSPLLALDIGLKRTGVALSESGLIAQPLGVIEWQLPHAHAFIEEVLQYIRKHEIQTLVVGLPLGEDNEPTAQSLKTEHLITQIEEKAKAEGFALTVVRQNEFHSTVDATALYPNTDKDAAAATLLLQDYLEQHPSQW